MKYDRPLLVHNLLINYDDLSSLLVKEVRLGGWLNAFLLAAGLNQMIEDHIHQDGFLTGKIARTISRNHFPAGLFLYGVTQKAGDIFLNFENLLFKSTRLYHLQQELAGIVQDLADIVTMEAPSPRISLLPQIKSNIKSIKETAHQLSNDVVRLPSCFRSFDQQPADIERLVQDFTAHWPDRFRPIAVVGIRTSGSYLAPLCVSYLKSTGFRDVTGLTFRPGRKFLAHERQIFSSIVAREGLVILIDDPPATGASLLRSIKELAKMGISTRAIVLLLQLFGPVDTLPSALQEYNAVLLPWDDWTIQDRLSPVSIHMMLDELFSQDTVNSVRRLPLAERKWERSHVRALYEVNVTELRSNRELTRKVFVEGAGLGYFGEHSLAVKSALSDCLPEIFGFRDGLLFRAWLPEQNRVAKLKGSSNEEFIKNLVGYVQKRHQAMSVPKDISFKLKGENSSWEVASNLLGKAFGKGRMLARLFFIDGMARRLLAVNNPSVIDGKMELENWFLNETGDNNLLKIGFSERDFSNLDLYSFDPVFDLAGLATSWPEHNFSEGIFKTYQELSGEQIDPERWLLYQWIHLWDQQRLMRTDPERSMEDIARSFRNYFNQVYFKDLELPLAGPICALDVDGVLETAPYGFPQLTASSALALRALILHGFRPVLATGRSLDDVRERCESYRLAGGTAEYGAVIYDHLTGSVEELLSEADCRNLDRLRTALSGIKGVFVDSNFRFAVRAYRKDAGGDHRGLSPDDSSLALELSHLDLAMRVIPGHHQTDFMVASIDKGTGLRRLLEKMDKQTSAKTTDLAFAVGDTLSDLPMLSLAKKAYIPRHADPAISQDFIQRMAGSYQSGLAQAVQSILGHKPGTCPVCQWSARSRQRELFLGLLSAQEGGTWGMVAQAVKLSASSLW